MAQPWSLRYLQVDGQGNFGSVDGDGAAAMRYTEARLAKIAEEMLKDIDKDTVDFQPNFDDTLTEPTVLPTRIPTLLVNGASGIAVGMATNMPPHNLSEVINAITAYIDNKDCEVSDLMKYVKAPDFPTGGYIYGISGVKEAFETGRGRVVIRAKAEIESEHNRDKIVITEIPYLVNKAEPIKNIASLVDDKKLDGISNINDESDRQGMRIVIDVKKDANASVVLNKLYKMTACQSAFSVNNIALVNGRPKLLNLKDLISSFVDHRHEVVIRRTRYELAKAQERAHILEGLIIASDNIDEVIAIIRSSQNPVEAKTRLIERFELSDLQASAIVEMRLRQLTGLEQDKLHAEYEQLMKQIEYYNQILSDEALCMKVVKDELIEVKEKYGDERRSEIVYSSEEFNPEDFYADDEMIITISHLGYIKRTPLSEFKAQNRGGVGSKGSNTREEDFIEYIYPASMHNTMLFFTQKGRCFWLKVYEIPEGTKNTKGRAIQNLLNIDSNDKVNAFIKVKNIQDADYCATHSLVFCTKRGLVKKTRLSAYARPRTNGINAININENDQVIAVSLTDGTKHIIMANKNGRAICFPENKVRVMGRIATGVRGMRLDSDDDEVIGMITVNYPGIVMENELFNDDNISDNDEVETPFVEEEVIEPELFDDSSFDETQESDVEETVSDDIHTILVVSENGYGKRSVISSYRITNRGGKGVKTLNITEKTGSLVAIKDVTNENDLMIINKSGIAIRLHVEDLRVMGRATQGVRLINLEKKNDSIASVCKVMTETEEEEIINEDDQIIENTEDIN
jgi:DNA gyrase, A subunit